MALVLKIVDKKEKVERAWQFTFEIEWHLRVGGLTYQTWQLPSFLTRVQTLAEFLF